MAQAAPALRRGDDPLRYTGLDRDSTREPGTAWAGRCHEFHSDFGHRVVLFEQSWEHIAVERGNIDASNGSLIS